MQSWTAANGNTAGPDLYDPGTCHICVIPNSTGPKSWYEVSARDASNFAMGDTTTKELGPGASIRNIHAFHVGAKDLTLSIVPNKNPEKASAVSMIWGGNQPAPQMSFDPATHQNSRSCNLTQSSPDDGKTYAQCSFLCEPEGLAESANSTNTANYRRRVP